MSESHTEPIHVLISTGNPDKAHELRALLGGRFVVQTKNEAGFSDLIIDETGSTLEENARLKVVGLYRALLEEGKDPNALWILADDTGLFVDALDGRPGVYSARYAGPGATYADNVHKLQKEMEATPWQNRGAHFRTVIALCRNGETETVEGILEGRILEQERGTNGFGYDPLFYVAEEGRTLAEMSDVEKNHISHRSRAYRALLKKLEEEGVLVKDDDNEE